MLDTFRQYWETLSHLRTEQLAGQVWVRMRPLRRWFERLQRTEAETYPGCRSASPMGWKPPPQGLCLREDVLQGKWSFLQDERSMGWPPAWPAKDAPKLWQYNLHYFEWLWHLNFEEAKFIVEDWIDFSRKHPEHVGLEPYPLSLRLTNWCGFFFVHHLAQVDKHPHFRAKLWRSLCDQAEQLERRLEYHLLGNHLFENAAALALLGGLFYGAHAQRWRKLGYDLLQRELYEQILSDGMHFERSPMYHTRLLFVVMLLAEFGDEEVSLLAERFLPKMKDALLHLCHPDGQIALLNDSAFGIYHEPADLFSEKVLDLSREGAISFSEKSATPQQNTRESFLKDFASSLPLGVWSLPEAGYYGARNREGSYLVCDVGPIGPDYLPGHAHGDLFSFEMSLRGHRIIVDSGVYDYLPSAMRSYARSTKGHNTVEIEGCDQCEFWGAFRVAKRAYPHDLLWLPKEEGFSLQAWHDGYLRLPQKARHERRFDWSQAGSLVIHDRIVSAQAVSAVARLHLHPDCSIEAQDATSARLRTPAGDVRVCFFGEGELLPQGFEESWYLPFFGVAQPNPVLCFRSFGSSISFYCVIE